MLNVNEIRKDFPMLENNKNIVYLDNAATTFKNKYTIQAVNDYYNYYTANSHRGDYSISQEVDRRFEQTRETVARFLNCDSKEVVFTSGASASLNLVAYGYGEKYIKEGDVILTTEAEHASCVLPLFKIRDNTKAKIEYIPLDQQGRLTVENFKKVMNEKVKMVVFAAVTNVLGYIAPVKEICQIAHQYGAVVCVDGAQSVPHTVTDVKDMDCDFLAFSSHKLTGPSGVGVLYGKYDLLQKMDPFMVGGGSNARFDMCGNLLLKEAPYKFESGTQPIEAVLGMGAAIEYLMHIGMANIEEYEKELHQYAIDKIKKLDNIILYNQNGDTGIITFNVKDVFAQDSASYLDSKGICVRSGNHCAKILVNFLQVSATIRASLYFYTTKQEIDAFVEALKTTTAENAVSVII